MSPCHSRKTSSQSRSTVCIQTLPSCRASPAACSTEYAIGPGRAPVATRLAHGPLVAPTACGPRPESGLSEGAHSGSAREVWIDLVEQATDVETGGVRHHDGADPRGGVETHHAVESSPAALFVPDLFATDRRDV